MDVLSVVCLIIGAAASACAVMSWLHNRKKEAVNEEKEDAEQQKKNIAAQVRLESDLAYIRNGVDDIRLEQRAQEKKIEKTNERVARLEEHSRDQDARLNRLEGKQ